MDCIDQWLKAMGEELGQDIQLNEEGMCNLQCEDDVMIIVESQEESPVFYLSALLAELPGDKDKMLVLFARALSLNLFTIETRGATIGLAEDLGQLMLCFMQEKETCDEERFAAILQGFHETLIALRKNLGSFVEDGDSREEVLPPNGVSFA